MTLPYSPVHVDGWSGMVLSGDCVSLVTGRALSAPTTQQWTDWLKLLVTDWRKVPGCKSLKTSDSVDVVQTFVSTSAGNADVGVVAKQVRSNSLFDSLRASPSRRNFDRALRLYESGIATALPFAYLERRAPQTSWLVTEFLGTVMDLDSFALTVLTRPDSNVNRKQRSALISAIAQMFCGIERAGLYHRDMKASNILVSRGTSDEIPKACIVDLDGLFRARPWRSRWKPIKRLAASLLQYPGVTTTDSARFLRDYMAARGGDPVAWPAPFRRLRKQAARYAQAARNRKSNKLDGFTG